MARLPIDISELSNRNEMPTGAMAVQQADGRNFGSQVGAAVAGVGGAVSGLALKIEANKRQSAGFEIEQQFLALQEEEAREYEERTRGLAGSGEGHWEATRAATAEKYNAWVDGLPTWAQDEYRTKAAAKVASRSGMAFQDQYRQQDNNTRAVLSDEERKAGLAVQEDPESFEAFRARQHELIDKSTLPAAEKEARKREIDSALAVTAAESDALNNPEKVVAGQDTSAWLKYSNQGAIRNDPLDPRLVTAMAFLPSLGVTMDVISGGQESNEPGEGTGSTRHNHGMSGDVDFYKDGRKLDWNNPADMPLLVQIVQTAKSRGVTGIGAGDDYMGAGRFHIGFGAAAVWGAGGKRENAPQWLVDAYNGAPAGELPAAAVGAAPPAYLEYLTPEQRSAYERTAQTAFKGQIDAARAVADAQRKASQDAVMLSIMEGPDPDGAYQAAREEGLFGSFEEVKKLNAAREARVKSDETAARGADIVAGAAPASRLSGDDRLAVNSVFTGAVKAGVEPEAAARMAFDRTGIVPPDFAKGLIAGAASRDATTAEGAFVAAANLLGSDQNAFNGVSGSKQLVEDSREFIRRTQVLGEDSATAAATILAERQRPKESAAVQAEALKTFRKDVLTPETIEAGLAAAARVEWGRDAAVPAGEMTGGDAMRAIYGGLAEEGFRKFGDADRALDYAATEIGRRFGIFNGTLTQYPPDKAGLPALPRADDPYAWVAEQAASAASAEFGLDVPPGQIVLVPVEQRGVSTRAAFGGTPLGIPGKAGKASVPYSIVVLPEDGAPPMMVPGVFLPDIEEYVAAKNATLAAPVVADDGSTLVEGEVAVMTPEQAQTADVNAATAKYERKRREALRPGVTGDDGMTLRDAPRPPPQE